MQVWAGDRRLNPYAWLRAHAVDAAFGLLVLWWLACMFRITRGFSFWSDDLVLIDQAGSWGGLIKPYNGHLSVLILSIYRALAELSGLAYTPFVIAGALSLVAVPVSYFLTARRQLGPTVAAIVAIPLLWYDGMILRPAALNHFLALVGAIFCAAALNRGRRADGVLAAALVFSLCSSGAGVVVAVACLVHNALVRPPLRRWLAVVVPSALWGGWWLLVADAHSPRARDPLSIEKTVRVVVDLCLSPFSHAGFGSNFLAPVLLAAFLLYGAMQLRRGFAASANFVAWSGAMVLWALSLAETRGSQAIPHTFRYTYLALGFALLAVVPRRVISRPELQPLTKRRWLAAAVVVLAFGGASGLAVRRELQDFGSRHAEFGREAKGTMLVVGLGPYVIPDSTPITFFGFGPLHGSARQLRSLFARYGSPIDARPATADQDLVGLGIARSRLGGKPRNPRCRPLTEPLLYAGSVADGLGLPARAGHSESTPGPSALQLWSPEPFTVDVRRYGDTWVRLAEVPAGRTVFLTLPVLDSASPWRIRAAGACDVRTSAPATPAAG